jgi:hypothetical protein
MAGGRQPPHGMLSQSMAKDFDRWNGKKKELNGTEFSGYVHEREVWWCALGVNVGVEADGKHDNFERPVLIVRKFSRDSVLIIPLTTRTQIRPYHVMFEHSAVGWLHRCRRYARSVPSGYSANYIEWTAPFSIKSLNTCFWRSCRDNKTKNKSAPTCVGASGAAWP